jgi:hypothetical protein
MGLGARSRLIVAYAFFGLCVKRAQRPVLRHITRSMDLRSVRNRKNRGQTLRGWLGECLLCLRRCRSI